MNRFSQLEFGESSDGNKKEIPCGEPVRDENFFYHRALVCWLAADFENALRNYSRSVEMKSSFLSGWVGQVWMLIELGEYSEALLWADRALEMFPEHPELFAAKALAYLRDQKLEKAQAFSDNALSKDHVTAEVWLVRSELLLAQKNNMAENCIRNAIGISGNLAILIKLKAGRILRKYDRPSMAMEYLDAAVRGLSKSVLAWYELGCCQAKLGFKEAQTSFQQALALKPGWKDAETALSRSQRGFFRRLFGR